ncbi:AhpD family alkylhydroperoxidase [Methanohalophilus levihalophilus]|uniref:carboxymuconolactone decarboxylase family protein n=1 Tax=Methanohalophilus levihalophilus TaxID=1431282 RepID=UPI001AEA9AFB|nr:carboxymuconolactone decarboxylase family protein [Methanohalophilus levihalophilus]MBP2031114.1 AhpD family alkylhydroperoxidase [Methanohalophilus levihalophilus]
MSEHEEVVKSIGDKMGFTPKILETLKDIDPHFVRKYNRCNEKILTDGAIEAKYKVLMALAVVASKQCEACTVSQMRSALNHGATKEEIMETMEVISITSGAPAVAACRDALKLLKD